MSDEGFHEIQLDGKQLIFLSMTSTVILVVVFLSGVWVGRGVHSQREPANAIVTTTAEPGEVPAPVQDAAPPPVVAVQPPTPSDEELSFPTRLQGEAPPAEPLPAPASSAAASKPVEPKPAAATPPAAKPTPAAPVAAAAGVATADPAGPGFVLRVFASKDKAKADALLKKLAAGGHKAYLVAVPQAGGTLYSVRVGKYPTRRAADAARRRIEKEERIKSSISR